MKKIVFSIVLSLFLSHIFAQTKQTTSPLNARPKLVVGIVIDQMRWDYLYRYYDRYDANGGFKRLLNHFDTAKVRASVPAYLLLFFPIVVLF